jgi:hypothetical protein
MVVATSLCVVIAVCMPSSGGWTIAGAHAETMAAQMGSTCVSDWYVSYGGVSNYMLINTDPDGLPITDLRFDRGYSDPTDLSKGYLDFNRDGKSDVFSAVPMGNGLYQWRYSSGGSSPWINIGDDSIPPDQLRFGDFNGDGYTDVFAAVPVPGGYQWKYSPGGANNYVDLAFDTTSLDQLRFGDFNGDGRTDVFTLKDLGNGYLGWDVSYSGTLNYQQINSATTLLSDMQFGDINGDGHTDVFTTIPGTNPSEYQWLYSSAGTSAYQTIVLTNLSVHDVRLIGDFNGDQRSDFFFTSNRMDGYLQWWYFYYQQNPYAIGSNKLAFDGTPPDQLRFADFNGDGVTDVFKLVRRCSTFVPVVER